MKRILSIILTFALLAPVATPAFASSSSRIKDIINVEGIRENILMGYGLVVGLNGTGDKLNNNLFTQTSLESYLERVGVNIKGTTLKTKNVAAVTVTATLPAFARQGSKMDVRVSAMGDATSLQGGVLLATPLMAADGAVYAVGQGPISIGGFSAKGDSGSSVTKAVPTTGTIANGGIVEKEVGFELNQLASVGLSLKNPDMTTAMQIEQAINEKLKGNFAKATDPGTVTVNVPDKYKPQVGLLISEIEQLQVEPDQVARIVIDETSGTIVMGENVRIDTVAVAQGNLTVRIDEAPQVSQPGAFAPAGATTAEVPRTTISVDEQSGNRMVVLKKGANLKDLVNGLNSLGVGPRDLISILENIKAAGALQADIQIR